MEYDKLVERLLDLAREQEAFELMPAWTEECYLGYVSLMAEREGIEAILLEMERVNP